jgi:hypothetical protein
MSKDTARPQPLSQELLATAVALRNVRMAGEQGRGTAAAVCRCRPPFIVGMPRP